MYHLIQHWTPFRLSNIRLHAPVGNFLGSFGRDGKVENGKDVYIYMKRVVGSSCWSFSNWLLVDFRNRECPNSTSCFIRLLRKKPRLSSQFRGNNEIICAWPIVLEGLAVTSVVSTLVVARWQALSLSAGTNRRLRPIPGNSFHQLLSKISFHSRNTDQQKWKIIAESSINWSQTGSRYFFTMNPLLSLKSCFCCDFFCDFFFDRHSGKLKLWIKQRLGFPIVDAARGKGVS